MRQAPLFPRFEPLVLADRAVFQAALAAHPPRTSELNFTNLFIWRSHFETAWCRLDDWLLVALPRHPRGACALEPIGPPGRAAVARRLLEWLAADAAASPRQPCDPRLVRAGRGLADELAADGAWSIAETRDHFDYVYAREDLARLRGKRLHAKRNHINRFSRSREWRYRPLDASLLPACRELAELWCGVRACAEDLSLSGEQAAVSDLFDHWAALELRGAVVLVDGRVEAFTAADRLNPDTAVVHVEKANPALPELYALINQQFVEHAWPEVAWINREQDLGEPGLRKAKLSYRPARLEEKFELRRV